MHTHTLRYFLLLLISTTSLLVYGQPSASDTVNTTQPGVRSIRVEAFNYKRNKRTKNGRVVHTEHFAPEGRIRKRELEEVTWTFNDQGQPDTVEFSVIEIGNGAFSRYWAWNYQKSDDGKTVVASVSRSKYGRQWELFRRDSTLFESIEDEVTRKTIYHSLPPFSQPELISVYQYRKGRLSEQMDASGKVQLRYRYELEDGNLKRMVVSDPSQPIPYLETFHYADGKLTRRIITNEYGEKTVVTFLHNEKGLVEEATWSRDGQPFLTWVYSYTYY